MSDEKPPDSEEKSNVFDFKSFKDKRELVRRKAGASPPPKLIRNAEIVERVVALLWSVINNPFVPRTTKDRLFAAVRLLTIIRFED